MNGRVWEVGRGKPVADIVWPAFPGEWHHAFSVAWSPDDKSVAVGSHWRVTVHDLPAKTKQTVWFGLDQRVLGVCFTPRGDILAAAGGRRRLAGMGNDQLESEIPGTWPSPSCAFPRVQPRWAGTALVRRRDGLAAPGSSPVRGRLQCVISSSANRSNPS